MGRSPRARPDCGAPRCDGRKDHLLLRAPRVRSRGRSPPGGRRPGGNATPAQGTFCRSLKRSAPVEFEILAVNLDQKPAQASADSGYFSEAAVTAEALAGIDLHVAPQRQKHGDASALPRAPDDGTVIGAMRAKLQTTAGHAVYALRKAIVEPVFGQMKVAQDAGRLRLRGRGDPAVRIRRHARGGGRGDRAHDPGAAGLRGHGDRRQP